MKDVLYVLQLFFFFCMFDDTTERVVRGHLPHSDEHSW